MKETIDAILLASGYSRRFGPENKLLQPFRGKPLAAHALQLACSLGLPGEILFVHADPEVGALADALPVRNIRNTRPDRGLCESVRLGTAASTAEYYLFMHCDQPLLEPALVHAVLARRRPGGIIVPTHAGTPGNPVLFSSFFREELLTLNDGETPKILKTRFPDRVTTVETVNAPALRDIDTINDLTSLYEEQYEKGATPGAKEKAHKKPPGPAPENR